MATHHRSQNGRSKTGKSQKPGLIKRHSGHVVSKSKSVQIRDDREDAEEDQDLMAASFLQYCATCEKQIITPSNSILYCSESCRKKDRTRIPSYDGFGTQSPPMSPLQPSASFDRFHDIVPQRSPTAVHIPRNRFSYSSFSEDETVYSEDDEKYSNPRRESEAERHLRYFAEQQAIGSQSRTPRPQFNRSSTGYSTTSNVPSLSHSPTSTAAGMSFPYTPASRPLPPRTNPTYSTSFKYSKSIDLVNPFPAMTQIHPTTAPSSLHNRKKSLKSIADTATSQATASGDVVYEKSSIPLSTSGPEHGSLKKLFRFSEMQAPPHQYERY